MNSKLLEEREKARKLLTEAKKQAQSYFNLSDLKNDKTGYLDKTPRSAQNSPFEPKEILARSTAYLGSKPVSLDFDEIMKNSCSQAVRNKYRESMMSGRLSSTLKTADVSLRTSMSSNQNERMSEQQKDIWDESSPFFSSLSGKNLTYSNEEFVPAENMAEQLDEDERMQENEYAVIPRVRENQKKEAWQESMSMSSRQPEMSFGQYCSEKIQSNNIRDIYGNKSPPKRQNREALVEITSNESTLEPNFQKPSPFPSEKLNKYLEKFEDSPKTAQMIRDFYKSSSDLQQDIEKSDNNNMNPFSTSICQMMSQLNFDKILELAEKERSRHEKEKADKKNENIPVKDDDSLRSNNDLQIPGRGLKRRPSIASDTPKSALDKCFRTKSPTAANKKEIDAARLKPQIISDDIFKVPAPFNSTLQSTIKSPSNTRSIKIIDSSTDMQTSSSREYKTAHSSSNFSQRSGEKLSLPNYSLQRPPTNFISPPSGKSSNNTQWSPNGCDGKLKRSSSQISNGSEFTDDFLPIKIKNIDNRKLSFESVKIDRSGTKSISIQNGSDKKLPLRVRIIGAGFSVSPKEDFRMVPMEARTFTVKFSPSVIGPARGCLIFELMTNTKCSKMIPLYAYGGHANICIEGVQKGPFGPHFVTMGNVQDLNYEMEQKIRLKNTGTLASFASLVFERTKLSDFALSDSLTMHPMKAKIDPGKFVDITIRFKASKSEIRKIFAMNKDVTTIGEICVICGDEPTRIRILKNKNVVDKQFLDYLPKSLPNEGELQAQLSKFDEGLNREKLTAIMSQIRTHEIALTINRNLDDTQCFSAEISLNDDTHMSFETFIDNNQTRMNTVYGLCEENDCNNPEMLESKFFRIIPSELTFNRSNDTPNDYKIITMQSTCNEDQFVEAVPSNHKLISATRSMGKLLRGEEIEIKVMATERAFQHRSREKIFVAILVQNARVEIPVNFID